MLALILLSCVEEKIAPSDPSIQEESIEISDPEYRFSIAMIADPHIGGGGAHSERLSQVVDWLNDHQESRDIRFVGVLGDIGWREGLTESKQLLDELAMPYIPVIGDNEVHFGEEESFGTVYHPQYQSLSESFDDWNMAGSAVWNPEHEQDSFFYNFAFSYQGLRIITVDWASRSDDSILSEMGDLHDFNGGSWEFFASEIQGLEGQKYNSALILSHIPMYFGPGSFDQTEAEQVVALTENYSNEIYANFAGHFHFNSENEFEGAGFDYYVTDAVWDDLIAVRLIEVWENELGFSYEQELIEFGYEAGE